MKTTGWILIVIGALSFIGAASKGHSVFGPLFCLGLGGTLIYLKKEKDEEPPMKLPDTPESHEQMMEVRKKETREIFFSNEDDLKYRCNHMEEKKNSSKLSEKTKQELLNIIFRKDAREVSLQEEIKELNSQIKNLHFQIDKDYTTIKKMRRISNCIG